jgi:hypothetical protein
LGDFSYTRETFEAQMAKQIKASKNRVNQHTRVLKNKEKIAALEEQLLQK